MARSYQLWFYGWAISVILFGVVLAGGALPQTDAAAQLVLTLLDGPGPREFSPLVRFSLGVCGPVSMGWGIGMIGVVRVTHMIEPEPRRILWTIFSAGVLTWFVIDSCLSTATGFGRNVIPNCLLIVGYVVPLLTSGVLGRTR